MVIGSRHQPRFVGVVICKLTLRPQELELLNIFRQKVPEIGSIKVISKVILLWFVRVVIRKLALRRQELEHRPVEVAQIGNIKHI